MDRQNCESGCGVWKTALQVAAGIVAAAAVTNAVIAALTPPAEQQLGGTFGRYPYRHGSLAYTVAGSGPPLLLLHGLGAGNSMAEWSANFDALRAKHTVYALDLPGWGLSSKPDREYLATDFVDPLLFFVEDIIGGPCSVIASSDACNFAIAAAAARPELFEKLVLVCPASRDYDVTAEAASPFIERIFEWPIVGTSILNYMTSRARIRAFAERHLFYNKDRVTDNVVTRHYVGAHQPGAKVALAAFIAGRFELDSRAMWGELEQPALLVWGRNTLINPIEAAPEWLALKPDAELQIIDNAMLLPHAEHPEQFNDMVLRWLD